MSRYNRNHTKLIFSTVLHLCQISISLSTDFSGNKILTIYSSSFHFSPFIIITLLIKRGEKKAKKKKRKHSMVTHFYLWLPKKCLHPTEQRTLWKHTNKNRRKRGVTGLLTIAEVSVHTIKMLRKKSDHNSLKVGKSWKKEKTQKQRQERTLCLWLLPFANAQRGPASICISVYRV